VINGKVEKQMEKELDENIGSVKIADDVVAMIAGLAATQVVFFPLRYSSLSIAGRSSCTKE
jgi:hypothetical protein